MMIMLAPFSGPWLVAPPKFIPGLEADIVMESITLKTPAPEEDERNGLLNPERAPQQ